MTSFIAAGGSGRSASFIPAVPAACSVTTIAFIVRLPVCGGSSSVADETKIERRNSMGLMRPLVSPQRRFSARDDLAVEVPGSVPQGRHHDDQSKQRRD